MTQLAIEAPGRSLTLDQLRGDTFGLRERVPRGGSAIIRESSAALVAAAVVGLDGWAREVRLAGSLTTDDVPADAVDLDLDARAETSAAAAAGASSAETQWWLYSSGTTGTPKAVAHTLGSLTRTCRPTSGGRRTWGLLYEPTRMAGVQVLLQALTSGDHLLDAVSLPHLSDRVVWLAEHGVDSLSATPTMWRQILQVPASGDLRLAQVTLGGEIADQRVLDALRRAFPQARITHVFASTETGAAFGVSDGREGFPVSYLEQGPGGVGLEIRDGILHVTARTSVSDRDGWVSTGDLVEVRDGRVLFRGRASGLVNVGGAKVAPEQVEGTLRSHPEVTDAVVTARRNAFSGWILVASVVPAAASDRATLPARLRELCAATLRPECVPATVKVVDELSVSTTGKAVRR